MVTGLLWVSLGGAIGSAARFLIGRLATWALPPGFPWGTFIVNAVGCFAFGVLSNQIGGRPSEQASLRAFVLVGLLGGFTTYSSFAFETVALMRAGQPTAAAFNVGGQLAVGLGALWLGLRLTS